MKEDAWLKHVMKLLDSDGEQQMSWSAFHAACEASSTVSPISSYQLYCIYVHVKFRSWLVIVQFLPKPSISSGRGQVTMVRTKW